VQWLEASQITDGKHRLDYQPNELEIAHSLLQGMVEQLWHARLELERERPIGEAPTKVFMISRMKLSLRRLRTILGIEEQSERQSLAASLFPCVGGRHSVSGLLDQCGYPGQTKDSPLYNKLRSRLSRERQNYRDGHDRREPPWFNKNDHKYDGDDLAVKYILSKFLASLI
jgi:hypothetical protein